MAYDSGSVANPIALRTVIENFALANGFTLNDGSGSWLSKGQTHIKLAYETKAVASITRLSEADARLNLLFSAPYETKQIAVGDLITVAGADIAAYNGTFPVNVVVNQSQIDYSPASDPVTDASNPGITVTIASSSTTLQVLSANSSDGLTTPSPHVQGILIDLASWPVLYELFYSPTPDQLTCVLKYDTDRIQVITFGEIVKVHDSAYVGGNWSFASRSKFNNYYPGLHAASSTSIMVLYLGAGACLPFPTNSISTIPSRDVGQVHCEIDTRIWPWASSNTNNNIILTDYTLAAIFRSPNSWNSQTHLVPMHLQFPMASSLYGYIGYIEHLRLVRVDNYEVGDIITLGSDTWKVYPWVRKDASHRNGESLGLSTSPSHSGTYGFACRYVP